MAEDQMTTDGDATGSGWEDAWEIDVAVRGPEDMLTAMLMRDFMHGQSVDVDLADQGGVVEVDYLAGDEEDTGTYRLLLTAHVRGPVERALIQELTRNLLEEALTEAERLAADREPLGSRPLAELRFVPVPENEERWDLVVPDWLAPDGAEVPFGFRPLIAASGEPWPSDTQLDAHGRVVAVAHDDTLHLYGVPAPSVVDEERRLPVHPSG
jgi:hypothetical protein